MQSETPTPDAVPAEDGSVVVRLVTELGEADITVPPRGRWRSTARSAISRNDDLTWAVLTLSDEDAQAWMNLDPTGDESTTFFEAYAKVAGLTNRADRRRNLRSVS